MGRKIEFYKIWKRKSLKRFMLFKIKQIKPKSDQNFENLWVSTRVDAFFIETYAKRFWLGKNCWGERCLKLKHPHLQVLEYRYACFRKYGRTYPLPSYSYIYRQGDRKKEKTRVFSSAIVLVTTLFMVSRSALFKSAACLLLTFIISRIKYGRRSQHPGQCSRNTVLPKIRIV